MIDVLVLCYHAVSPTWSADLSVTPANLERQVEWLLGRGYVPATFTQAVHDPPAARTLAVTFDDGFRSVHALAWPILRRLGVPATLFVPTGLLGADRLLAWPGIDHWQRTPDARELTSCGWDEVRELSADGWEIGSHSRTHPRLTTLDDQDLDEELARSRTELEEQLPGACTAVAYPYGDHDERVLAAAARAGYDAAATLPNRFPRRPAPLLWPRLGVYHGDSLDAFQRRTTPGWRRLSSSPLWPAVEVALPRIRRAQHRLRTRATGRDRGATPALRLLASRPRLATGRAAVLGAGALARVGGLRAHTIWPSVSQPSFIVEAGHRQGASFMRRTFDPHPRALARVEPASWNVLRARGLLLRGDGGLSVAAAEHALGRPLRRPRVAAFSPSGGGTQKMTCFVFEGEAEEPVVVVKAIGDPAHSRRLRAEAELVARLRGRLAADPEVAGALPMAPLLAGECRGEYVVVEPLDRVAAGTGRADRSLAHGWLRGFQAATRTATAPWDAGDEQAALAAVEQAWRHARPSELESVARRVGELMAPLRGTELPRCAVHGDFWRGNIAVMGGELRVYDWEWAQLDGRPLFDLWTYELAELRFRAQEEEPDGALATAAVEAIARMESELASGSLDPRLARATLAPSLAEISFRIRAATGRPGGNEAGSVRLMGTVAAVLGAA